MSETPRVLPRNAAPDTGQVSPVEVSRVASNLPFVLRTVGGMSALGVGVNVVGVVVVALVVGALNATATPHQFAVMAVTTVVLTAVAVVVGVGTAVVLQRRTLRWLLRGDTPNDDEARLALRIPLEMAALAFVLWLVGGVGDGIAAAVVNENAQTVIGLVGGIVLAAFVSAALTYLLMERVNHPVAQLALAARPPETVPVFGVRWRLMTLWAVTSGMPIIGLLLVLTSPPGKTHLFGASIVVAVVTLVVGGGAMALAARAIGAPLRTMVSALRHVGDGDLDTSLTIEDSGEIGLMQNGFNDMVAGLRERERIQDLFGRHVGPSVAEQAISRGVTMRGDALDVVALFVDIAGSTRLTRDTDPGEFVAMLNRFFEIVVDEVEGRGGLVNKFEGDAALCVFGAPVHLDEPATAALATARAVRDRVRELGEFEIGIGVAAGPVIAGQIGAASRLEYTVIGDAVNEAARLTELAKRVDGYILAAERAVAAADDDEQAHWARGRQLRLRGRETPTVSYRNVEPNQPTPSLAQRLTDVARVVTEFPPHPLSG